jgi:hypothetical protein
MISINRWLWATSIALLLSASVLLDGPDDLETARAYQQEVLNAPRMAAEEDRIERAATELCQRLNGPGSAHRWTEQGQLRCISADGKSAQQLGNSI